VRQSEDEIMAGLLGIPNVHVISLEETKAGLRVVVETKDDSAPCPMCDKEAKPTGRRPVELDSEKPFLGRHIHLTWQTRGYRCENPACSTGTFYEEANWPFSVA
jgi:hypothetical protein